MVKINFYFLYIKLFQIYQKFLASQVLVDEIKAHRANYLQY